MNYKATEEMQRIQEGDDVLLQWALEEGKRGKWNVFYALMDNDSSQMSERRKQEALKAHRIGLTYLIEEKGFGDYIAAFELTDQFTIKGFIYNLIRRGIMCIGGKSPSNDLERLASDASIAEQIIEYTHKNQANPSKAARFSQGLDLADSCVFFKYDAERLYGFTEENLTNASSTKLRKSWEIHKDIQKLIKQGIANRDPEEVVQACKQGYELVKEKVYQALDEGRLAEASELSTYLNMVYRFLTQGANACFFSDDPDDVNRSIARSFGEAFYDFNLELTMVELKDLKQEIQKRSYSPAYDAEVRFNNPSTPKKDLKAIFEKHSEALEAIAEQIGICNELRPRMEELVQEGRAVEALVACDRLLLKLEALEDMLPPSFSKETFDVQEQLNYVRNLMEELTPRAASPVYEAEARFTDLSTPDDQLPRLFEDHAEAYARINDTIDECMSAEDVIIKLLNKGRLNEVFTICDYLDDALNELAETLPPSFPKRIFDVEAKRKEAKEFRAEAHQRIEDPSYDLFQRGQIEKLKAAASKNRTEQAVLDELTINTLAEELDF